MNNLIFVLLGYFLVENHITKLIYLIDTLAVCYTAYIDLRSLTLCSIY